MKQRHEELNFCAIDFETACPARASACAVGLVRVRNGVIAETFQTLIKPPDGMDIIPFFSSIHGLTMADIEHAPNFKDAWTDIAAFIGSDYLVAHNGVFDRNVLETSLAWYGIDYPIPVFQCTLQCARIRWPDLENHRLDTVSEFLAIELDHHEALSDAMACAQIYVAAFK